MPPTIFADPASGLMICKGKILGPIVVISTFTEYEAISIFNSTPYNLHGAVFTQGINRAVRVTGKICSGAVCINCCAMINASVPFGGVVTVSGDENWAR